MGQYGVEDTVFCEVDFTKLYNFTRTTKFAHMNGHWKDYDSSGLDIPVHNVVKYWKYYWIFNLLKFKGVLFTVFPTEIFNLSFLLIKIYSILL